MRTKLHLRSVTPPERVCAPARFIGVRTGDKRGNKRLHAAPELEARRRRVRASTYQQRTPSACVYKNVFLITYISCRCFLSTLSTDTHVDVSSSFSPPQTPLPSAPTPTPCRGLSHLWFGRAFDSTAEEGHTGGGEPCPKTSAQLASDLISVCVFVCV